ncbi:SCO2521 family protein [Nocardia asiatica]|uniref:SCO2521 family protein n=1 Tax=Nocardia asiatica TaxID=209252 RepID=UPI003EDE9F88
MTSRSGSDPTRRGIAGSGSAMGPTIGRPLVLLGEVRTSLLPNSVALDRAVLDELLTLLPGRPISWRRRPISLAISPTVAVGVDCQLAVGGRSAVRGVGTVATNAAVVGGRVLQSSARTAIVSAESDRRRSWSHYLARVGVLEAVSKVTETTGADLADAFLTAGRPPDGTLDLASIGQRLLDDIRTDRRLDQQVPMRTRAGRLLWAARITDVARPSVRFGWQDELVRTALVTVRNESELAAAPRFCADLALHDWLLTVVSAVAEEVDQYPLSSAEPIEHIVPSLTHLVHLWMPGVHAPAVLRGLWDQLERDLACTREWSNRIGQLRDRMSSATWAALSTWASGTSG